MRSIARVDLLFIRPGSRLILVLLGLVASTFSVSAQQPRQLTLPDRVQGRVKVSDEQGFVRAQLNRLSGTVLGEGSNDQPVGRYRVATYRIEEVTPPSPVQAVADGRAMLLEKVWRITITGGPFDLRDAPAVIWVDDEPVGVGVESPDLKSISTIIYDRSLLKAGASVALSYGSDPNDRTILPERIRMPQSR